MTEELWNILEEIYKLAHEFVEITGLIDEDCNGDYETPKVPTVVEELDYDILSDISCLNGDLEYLLGKKGE